MKSRSETYFCKIQVNVANEIPHKTYISDFSYLEKRQNDSILNLLGPW